MDPDDFDFMYTSIDLTEQINRFPNNYGLIQALGLFSSEGTISTFVEVRRENGMLRVLPAKERGAPGTPAERESGNAVIFPVPHFPHMDLITPKDIQDYLVAVARSRKPKSYDDELARRLENMRRNHSITLEYVRMGAIKGVILDGNGTELYDLFDAFDIEKKVVDFVLGTAGTDVMGKIEEVNDHIVRNLKGDVSNGVEIMVSSSFFTKLINHAKVEKYWLQTNQSQELVRFERDRLGGNWGRVFDTGVVRFRENKTTFPVKVNDVLTNVAAITADKGHAYPIGTNDTFKTWFAPADTIDAANQPGEEIFVSPEVLKHGKGVELWSESNPLAVMTQPEALVEVTTSN